MYSEARAAGSRSTLLGWKPRSRNQCAVRVVSTNRVFRPSPRALLDPLQQFVATPAVAVLRVDRQTGQLARLGIGDRIERGAGDDQPFALDDAELFDLAFQHLAGTAYQDALLFQRADQLDQPANVLDARLAQLLELLLGDQGAVAGAGE